MRPIKFRAWHKLTMKMDYSPRLFKPNREVQDCLLNEWLEMSQEHMNGVILMQFTGLHDKNGTPIWEGDIVGYMARTCSIRWGDVLARYVLDIHNPDAKALYTLNGETAQEMEVLGNIYENPELLKES